MVAHLAERLPVMTCIACGMRFRSGACPDGCPDLPLDLVEAADVDALAARLKALGTRAEALQAVAWALAEDAGTRWAELRAQASAALRQPVLMADATEYRDLAEHVNPAARLDEALGGLAHLVANVSPRPGQEERTRAALAERARQLTAAARSA